MKKLFLKLRLHIISTMRYLYGVVTGVTEMNDVELMLEKSIQDLEAG